MATDLFYPEVLEIPGFRLNPNSDIVQSVRVCLGRTGGNCPCVPKSTWSDATLCPCVTYRAGEGCHCLLYVKEEGE
jgi:ferredoxin-thioredoxin reductase catalytic subunit